MKIHALIAAAALALGGTAAFAQAGAATGSGTAGGASASPAAGSTTAAGQAGSGKAAGAKAMRKNSTRSMGASASPETDLEASDRRSRMDEAYANWQQRSGTR